MTDSLVNMLKSVDWSKLMSSGDAKNALIGSALGGTILGGASLAQDRDPEESKMAPVGDALVGAMLGGAAGYGIPKGLALFRDSGGLAPDGDRAQEPSLLRDMLSAGLSGGAAGVGTLAARDTPAAFLAWRRLVNRNADYNQSRMSQIRSRLAGYMKAREAMLAQGQGTAALDRVIARDVMAGLRERRDFWKRFARLHLDPRTVLDVIREMPQQGATPASVAADPKGRLGRLFSALGAKGPFFTHGSEYRPGTVRTMLGFSKRLGPVGKALLRYRNYGLGGAALGAGIPLAWKALSSLASTSSGNRD